MSIERLLLALEAEGIELEVKMHLDMYVVAMGEEAKIKAVELLSSFRAKGISADMDYVDRKMKAQMKSADRLGAKYVIVFGESELEEASSKCKRNGNRQSRKSCNLLN